jgi:hypothetical protein
MNSHPAYRSMMEGSCDKADLRQIRCESHQARIAGEKTLQDWSGARLMNCPLLVHGGFSGFLVLAN